MSKDSGRITYMFFEAESRPIWFTDLAEKSVRSRRLAPRISPQSLARLMIAWPGGRGEHDLTQFMLAQETFKVVLANGLVKMPSRDSDENRCIGKT